jgi:uncharacterized glyoxalase superfamily protein PhnB
VTDQRPLGLSSHIFVADADAAVAFYCELFGASELSRSTLTTMREADRIHASPSAEATSGLDGLAVLLDDHCSRRRIRLGPTRFAHPGVRWPRPAPRPPAGRAGA